MGFARIQFSIRLLLAATAFIAFVIAIMMARPTEYIDIEISKSGSVFIAGATTPRSEIEHRIRLEIQYRENWLQRSTALIRMPVEQMSPARFEATDWYNSLRNAGIDKLRIVPAGRTPVGT